MERCHLYMPLVDSSGATYTYAEVTLTVPGTGRPIEEPVYLEPHGGAPQSWPLLIDPAVINLWTDRPLRVTVQALLPGGSTFTRPGVDVAPAPSAIMKTRDPLRIGSSSGLDGSAILSMSPGGSASWQVLDGLRTHRHKGDSPGSTMLGTTDFVDIYPQQTWLGIRSGGSQGDRASMLGSAGTPNGDDATLVGRALASERAVAIGADSSASQDTVAVGPGSDTAKVDQVAVGHNASAAAGPESSIAVGDGVTAAAGEVIRLDDALTIGVEAEDEEAGPVVIGKGALPDLSWLGTSDYLALLGTAVAPRYLGVQDDAVLASAVSRLGTYGATGAERPLISTSTITPTTPGRAALVSLLAALDQLGLIYLLDGAIDDEFSDWTKSFAHNANMTLETGDADGAKAGDLNRARRVAAGLGTITYQVPTEVRDVTLRAFVLTQALQNHQNELTVQVSKDNSAWTTVPLVWQPLQTTAADWNQTWASNAGPVPPGMRYLRIQIDLNAQATSPQIGRAVVRQRQPLPASSPRVDLAGTHNTLFLQEYAYPTVIQGFAVDPVGGHIYVSQLIEGDIAIPGESAPVSHADRSARGDITVAQLSLADCTLLGRMYIKGAGHGITVCVEQDPDSDEPWLWVDGDSSSGGFGRALARIKFEAGAVLTSRQTPLFRPFGAAAGSHGLSAMLDPVHNRIAVRRTYPDGSANGRRYYLYDFDAFKALHFTPIATLDQAASNATTDGLNIGTFQGSATWGNYVYSLEGGATSSGGNTTYLTCLSWVTGQVVQRTLVTAQSGLSFREPEGMTTWTPDPAQPLKVKFAYGFASGVAGGRLATFTTIDTFID